jgi:hypothetical protein
MIKKEFFDDLLEAVRICHLKPGALPKLPARTKGWGGRVGVEPTLPGSAFTKCSLAQGILALGLKANPQS